MKYTSKITLLILFITCFLACDERETTINDEQQLLDNSENVAKLISSFDKTVKLAMTLPKISEDELGSFFIEEAKNQGVKIITEDSAAFDKTGQDNFVFSSEYLSFSQKLANAITFSNKQDYRDYLDNLFEEVKNSQIDNVEKQLLVDNIIFITAFVDWMENLENDFVSKNNIVLAEKSCGGWWSCWGKCVAGIIGSALESAVTGCGVGAAVVGSAGAGIGQYVAGASGAAIGGAAGALSGCAAGGIVGAIGGGLNGASNNCK